MNNDDNALAKRAQAAWDSGVLYFTTHLSPIMDHGEEAANELQQITSIGWKLHTWQLVSQNVEVLTREMQVTVPYPLFVRSDQAS